MHSTILVTLVTIGGLQAQPDDRFTDCVLVGRSGNEWDSSGVLVGPNVVVTAGHAYSEGEMNGGITQIFFGDDVRKPEKGRFVKVVKAIRHPKFDPINIKNDLMILVLDADVREARPHQFATAEMIQSARSVKVVGYGAVVVKGGEGFGARRSFEVPIKHPEPRVETAIMPIGPLKVRVPQPPKIEWGQEFIGADPERKFDSAAGDGGGPAFVRQADQWFLAGITSRGTVEGKGQSGKGTIYVRVDRYQDWIRQTAGDNGGRLW